MEIAHKLAYANDKPRRISLPTVFRSIRFRLTIWYVLILAVVLVVFSGLVYGSQAQSLRAAMNDTLRADGQKLAASFDPVQGKLQLSSLPDAQFKIVNEQAPVPVQVKRKEAWLHENDVVLVLDAKDTLVQHVGQIGDADTKRLLDMAQYGNVKDANRTSEFDGILQKLDAAKRSGMPVDDKQAMLMLASLAHTSESFFPFTFSDKPPGGASFSPDYYFYATVLMVGNEKVGTLLLGRPREDEAQLQRLLMTLLLVAPITLLLAAGGGYWLAARAMRPVRTIAQAAQRIGETELDRRLNLGTHDELGELAATFDGMLDRLETAFQRQRQFTADASHELRTPLTIVDLEVSHALGAQQTSDEYRRALAVIGDETASMTHLVNDLLTLARADAGRIVLQHEELDLSDLALEVIERLDSLARQNHVQLYTEELPELKIMGDRLYLSRMLSNLVENAIKYSSGCESWVRIVTGSLKEGERVWAWVRVEDNGPGIAPVHLPYLFDRFYRVDKARSHNESVDDANNETQPTGSGLGLSIVQWVAQAHGGHVRVESCEGHGSTFEVILPIIAQQL